MVDASHRQYSPLIEVNLAEFHKNKPTEARHARGEKFLSKLPIAIVFGVFFGLFAFGLKEYLWSQRKRLKEIFSNSGH